MDNLLSEIIDKGIAKAGTRSKFCKDCGISVATLWRLENGKLKNQPWARTIGRIAQYVNK